MQPTADRMPPVDAPNLFRHRTLLNHTTANLAASCHVVPGVASQISRRLLEKNHCFSGRSPGVQLEALTEHCKRALKRKRLRDILIVVCLTAALLSSLPVLVGLVLVCVLIEQTVSYRVARQIKSGSFELPPEGRARLSSSERQSLEAAQAAQRGNVHIYSGFEPFGDAGTRVGGWSFAINLKRGKVSLGIPQSPRSFTTSEAYEYICAGIDYLAIPGCSITDAVCASGRNLRNNRFLLPRVEQRPVATVPRAYIDSLVDAGDEHARLYKLVRVEAWDGELVFSMYFRLRKQADTLFIESSFLVLPPLRDRLCVIEKMNATVSVWTLLRETGTALLLSPIFAVGAFAFALELIGWPGRVLGFTESARRRKLREDPESDYGCRTSLRSWATADSFANYFQMLDKEMFSKIIERRLLDTLEQFLDDRGIDTTDIRARQETILNSGVIVSGNKFEGSNVSIARRVANVFSGNTGTPIQRVDSGTKGAS